MEPSTNLILSLPIWSHYLSTASLLSDLQHRLTSTYVLSLPPSRLLTIQVPPISDRFVSQGTRVAHRARCSFSDTLQRTPSSQAWTRFKPKTLTNKLSSGFRDQHRCFFIKLSFPRFWIGYRDQGLPTLVWVKCVWLAVAPQSSSSVVRNLTLRFNY